MQLPHNGANACLVKHWTMVAVRHARRVVWEETSIIVMMMMMIMAKNLTEGFVLGRWIKSISLQKILSYNNVLCLRV